MVSGIEPITLYLSRTTTLLEKSQGISTIKCDKVTAGIKKVLYFRTCSLTPQQLN